MRGRVTQQGSVQTGSGGVGASGMGYGIMSTRSRISAGQWEPTVVYLLLLVLFEMAAFAGLRYTFRSVHGG
jgi:hypothetical protein